MKRLCYSLAIAAALIIPGNSANAQPPLTPLPPTPLACEVGDLSTTEQRVVDATAYFLPKDYVIYNKVDNTYSIDSSPLTGFTQLDQFGVPFVTNICPSSNYYGVSALGLTSWWGRGRSAVMIGYNQFITAPHANSLNLNNWMVVFLPSGFPCTVSDLSAIPADNVYTPNNLFGVANTLPTHGGYDYLSFYVDRPVVGRKPLKMRRSGTPRLGDSIIHTGHSLWSGVRIDRYGSYHGNTTDDLTGSGPYESPLFSGIYPFEGASGGAVFNIRDEVLEAVVAAPVDGELTRDATASCVYDAYRNWSPNKTNGKFVAVSHLIPRQEVLVTPLDEIRHVGDIGGALTNAVSSYQIRGGVSSNQYAVDPDPSIPSSGAPLLTSSIPPGDLFASIVTPTTWTLTADVSGVSNCGIWDYEFNVRDRHNFQNNYIRHRFEIGVEEFEITPSKGVDILDFGIPITKTYTYTLRNVRPTATTLRLETKDRFGAASSWLRVNGGNLAVITLQAQGQINDTAVFTISVDEPAIGSRHIPRAILHVDHDNPACALASPISRQLEFTLALGRESFSKIGTGDFLVPPTGSASYGAPESYLIDVDEPVGLCTTDVKVRTGLMDSVFHYFPVAAEKLRIRLKSPLGTLITLWDMNVIPESTYYMSGSLFAFGEEQSVSYLTLDDNATPPLVSPLSTFDGEPVDGQWEYDIALGTNGTVLPIHVVLDIAASPCIP
jgi:hypothetical protein